MESTAEKLDHLGDFTTTTRVVPIAMLAIIIGAAAAYVAWALLNLIGLCTNLFFFQRFDTALVSPAGHHLGDVARGQPLLAYADETLKVIVYRMAETGLTRLPVVDRQSNALVGMLSLTDLLTARARILDAEQRRERVLGARLRWPGRPSAA